MERKKISDHNKRITNKMKEKRKIASQKIPAQKQLK